MSDSREELAESLSLVDQDIEDVRDEMSEALGGREYQDLLDIKVDLLRSRQVIVEQLEALGLEDPAL